MQIKFYFQVAVVVLFNLSWLPAQENTGNPAAQKFRQLEEKLPTPNTYRTASGSPGHAYWQQKADYVMNVELDEVNRKIIGSETITYHNNSPDELRYLWLQLDQNLFAPNSQTYSSESEKIAKEPLVQAAKLTAQQQFDGGYKISNLRDAGGRALTFTDNYTMMRIDLPAPLKPGGKYTFSLDWWYNIVNHPLLGGRSGYEFFEKDSNCVFEIAQFFPRMAVYSDAVGWQHKQFLGRGEFTLPFGDYQVNITVPADHILGATGELQNSDEVLTSTQLARLAQAKNTTDKPVFIVTKEEAIAAEKQKSKAKKTWKFKAQNVRDFAFACSRKFLWDAMAVDINGKKVMAMSLYPKEGMPLWDQYSTRAVALTLRVYSKYTIDYPYPVAISVHGPVWGMEYPMICFNGGRPEPDGTYSERLKYALISVIIHEVGHNFFPMIVNSDERQWTWLDEGLNSFMQGLAEKEWDPNYPSRRLHPESIVDYMKGDKMGLEPIMTNSESIIQFGNNAYGKPAVGLHILRNTIMGPALFDHAFKEYARKWAFKHPEPADFFRTMEDASAVDLDWFWRGWFYEVNPVDIALTNVTFMHFEKNAGSQAMNIKELAKNEMMARLMGEELQPEILEYISRYNPKKQITYENEDYLTFLAGLSAEQKSNFSNGLNLYELTFENKGGMIMPIIIGITYVDSSKEILKFPAEIWRKNADKVYKVLIRNKLIASIELDPNRELADINKDNNYFPPKVELSKFEQFLEKNPNNDPKLKRKKDKK